MREKLKNNSGYTLVEMIIVIAIIAVMSGMGALTIASIRTSQAQASMQKFDSELSALEMRTKTLSSNETIELVQNGANYDIYYATYDPTAKTYTRKNPGKPDATLERVVIYYSDSYDASTNMKNGVAVTDMFIRIRKSDGQVLKGEGQYIFCKQNSPTQSVGSVTLNKYTGGHTYGKNED